MEVTAGWVMNHFESKTDAETAANTIRAAIFAGTFERAADRLARLERDAEARAAAGPTGRSTLERVTAPLTPS